MLAVMRSTIFVLALSSTLAFAATVPCSPATSTDVTITGNSLPGTSLTSVTCGPDTLSNFYSLDASGGTTTGFPVSFIAGASFFNSATGTSIFSFNPNFFTGPLQDIHLGYTFTSTRPVTAVDASLGGTGGSMNERICSGSVSNIDPGSGACLAGSTQLGVLSIMSGQTGTAVLSTPATAFGVSKDISNARGDLTGFSQSFEGSTQQGVPEPATMGVVALGLAWTLKRAHRHGVQVDKRHPIA